MTTYFEKGNQLWKLAENPGKPAKYRPGELWEAACRYFTWVEENPILEDKVMVSQGEVVHEPIVKQRAMTKQALCTFLNISTDTYRNYGNKEEYVAVKTLIDQIIYAQKFEGAAAGLLKENLIARELGLTEKNEQMGEGGGPIKHETKWTVEVVGVDADDSDT